VLGSAGKGIGEARYADFGITEAEGAGIIYAKGQPLKKVPTEQLVEELFKEIDKYYATRKKVVVDDDQAGEAARWLSETRTKRRSHASRELPADAGKTGRSLGAREP
jgi:(E)-4-hydroxy-3-methylbut-2-enyl-diphosphate synthase